MDYNVIDCTGKLFWQATTANRINWLKWYYAQKGWPVNRIVSDMKRRSWDLVPKFAYWERYLLHVQEMTQAWVEESAGLTNDNSRYSGWQSDARKRSRRANAWDLKRELMANLRQLDGAVRSPSPSFPAVRCPGTYNDLVEVLSRRQS